MFEKDSDNKDVLKTFVPKGFLASTQFKVYLYSDRMKIFVPYKQPCEIPIRHITDYGITSSTFIKSVLTIYGNGTQLFSIKQLADYNKEFLAFLKENVPTSPNHDDNQEEQKLTLDDLPKLKKLLDDGIITQEDFNSAKKKLLY